MTSVYDEHAPRLVERGFFPLVIGPGVKKPQHHVPSLGEFHDTSNWTNERRPIDTSPQPGAGIGLRCGKQPGGGYVTGIDWDNEDAAIAALDSFPSTTSKTGKRGLTTFYYSEEPVPSRDFLINGVMAVQVLSTGRQTVLPPTIHPDTGKPYIWDSAYTLYNVRPQDLPRLSEDYVERIEAILRPLGYEPESERKPAPGNGDVHAEYDNHHYNNNDNNSPFLELNDLAIRNLAKWVPDLNLYKCRRRRGPHASFEAVATWRPSTTGRSLEQRDLNLKISPKGIKDFGNGETFSPLDLVMRAHGCSMAEAINWLSEHLRAPGGPEIDFEAIIGDALGIQPDDEPSKEEPSAGDKPHEQAGGEEPRKERRGRFKFTPSWELRPGAAETPYLVDELIPAKGIVLMWGPPKCLKSFFMLGMMWHVANGWEYRDRTVQQGAVMYCAFEGSHGYTKRVPALRRHYELDDDADRTPLTVMSGRTDLIRDHSLLVKEIREDLAGAHPVAVVLDTLNKSLVGSESKDVDMAAYMRAAEVVRDSFDCVVIVIHHCGWDESRPRGHSSQRGTVDAELSVTREGDIVTVTVDEMRDGPEGVQIVSKSRIIEVGEDAGGRPLTSLVLVPHEPGEAGGTAGNRRARPWPKGLRVFHDALIEALLSAGIDHQIENGPKVKAAELEKVRTAFYSTYVVSSLENPTPEKIQEAKRKAFDRALKDARGARLIGGWSLGGRQLVWLTQSEPSHAFRNGCER
jgi:AAA domain/Bifunctional DNA primase/polymerase, N-terminal